MRRAFSAAKPAKEFPREVAGKSFTFGARASTSGRLMPEFFIRQAFAGKAPEEIFSRVGFSGDHSRTIQLVQSGAFEVSVLDYSVWDLDQKAGKVDPAQVSVVWESPPFPDYYISGPSAATWIFFNDTASTEKADRWRSRCQARSCPFGPTLPCCDK